MPSPEADSLDRAGKRMKHHLVTQRLEIGHPLAAVQMQLPAAPGTDLANLPLSWPFITSLLPGARTG